MVKNIKWLVLALMSIVLLACSDSNTAEGKSEGHKMTNVDVQKFKELISSGDGVLLDVRYYQEFETGKISNAINIDYLSPTFRDDIMDLDRSMAIYIYCKSGARSEKACDVLLQEGFTNVYNLEGGIKAWENHAFEVIQ